MANQEHLNVLRDALDKKNIEYWNKWRGREDNLEIAPDLSGANLSRANLWRAYLSRANLRKTDLRNADLTEAFLREAILIRAFLRGAILTEAFLKKANLTEANLSEAKLIGANLSNADLSNADLTGANLSNADLTGANLNDADLSDADLSGANLNDADLSNADLSGANLSDADLSGANLNGANLSVLNLSVINLSGLNLSGANLSGANLSRLNLSRTKLNNANLSDADLSGANLSDADLSGANLSDANLSEANLSNIKGIETANLSNTNLYNAKGINLKENLAQREEKLAKELDSILQQRDAPKTKNPDGGLNELFQAIKMLKGELNLHLEVKDSLLKELIEIAFVASFKKEESRYPKFKLYVPEKQSSNLIMTFTNKDYENYENNGIKINLNKLSTFASIGLAIPQHSCALLVVEEKEELKLISKGIINIRNKDEVFGEIFKSQTNLVGLLLSIEDPGRLQIVCTSNSGIQVLLGLIEGKVRIIYDPVQNPLTNMIFLQIAKKIIKTYKERSESSKEFDHEKIFGLIKVIQNVWHRILKLAVDFGHGGQFVIVPEKNSQIIESFNIGQYATQKSNLGEYIINFFDKYYVEQLKGKKDCKYSEKLLIYYHQLVNCIDLLVSLSTMDGCIILEDNLSLIGFRGKINIKDDSMEISATREKYSVKTKFNYWLGDPLSLALGENDLSELLKEERPKFKELFSKDLEKKDKWNANEFGTRHNSAARLCSNHELDPFVFVVSQTGDIREFMNLQDDKGNNYVGVFGPLRPL